MFNLLCTVTHTSRVTRSQVSSGIALPSVHSHTGFTFISGCRQVELLAFLTSLYIFFNIIQPAASAAARVSCKETSVCWITLVK